MDVDTKALRLLAEAATPGPWGANNNEVCVSDDGTGPMIASCAVQSAYARLPASANADYISAAHPGTTLALIKELEDAKAQEAKLREALRKIAGISNECTWTPRMRPLAAELQGIIRTALNGEVP